MALSNAELLERLRADLDTQERAGAVVYYAEQPIAAGTVIVGPDHEKIKADRPSFLVFADDEPRANFSHACRYLFYDAETAVLHREVQANFPPTSAKEPIELIPFHQPVAFIDNPIMFRPW